MSIRTVITLFLCVFGIFFLAVNWSGIMAPVPVNLLYTQIQAPLGLIVLVVLGSLLVACVLWSLMQQAAVLLDIRKANKEAQVNKRLAEHAEQSRLETLAQSLTQSISELDKKLSEAIRTEAVAQAKRLDEVKSQLTMTTEKVREMDRWIQAIATANGVQLEQPEPAEEKKGFFTRIGVKRTSKAKREGAKASPPDTPTPTE